MQCLQTLCSESAMNQCTYRTTILAAVAFLDAFQKVADMATNSRGKGNLALHGVESSLCMNWWKNSVMIMISFVEQIRLLF